MNGGYHWNRSVVKPRLTYIKSMDNSPLDTVTSPWFVVDCRVISAVQQRHLVSATDKGSIFHASCRGSPSPRDARGPSPFIVFLRRRSERLDERAAPGPSTLRLPEGPGFTVCRQICVSLMKWEFHNLLKLGAPQKRKKYGRTGALRPQLHY